MKTFQQFLEEGKVKKRSQEILKDVKKDRKSQIKQNPNKPVVVTFGNPNSKPGSREREAAIRAMMDYDREGRREMRRNLP